jgi:hypothetical protein
MYFGRRKIIPILVYIIYRNLCACNVYINTDNWARINMQIMFWDHAIWAIIKGTLVSRILSNPLSEVWNQYLYVQRMNIMFKSKLQSSYNSPDITFSLHVSKKQY